jgi:hypothetical protein
MAVGWEEEMSKKKNTKPKQYAYRVVISQTQYSFDAGNEFGPQDGWGETIKKRLDRDLALAEVVYVKPMRLKADGRPA